MAVILAFDTSNYTTSISVISNNEILSDRRQLLTVEGGKRGLQQSEAIFKHINALPMLMEMVRQDIKGLSVDAIGVSCRPRPVEGSYMPVFTAGISFASFLSSYLEKPLFKFSHQEGHIEAALFSRNISFKDSFIALHLSGGTTEILKVDPEDSGYHIDIIGNTGDINAGQFIDRIGVLLGFDFPCGRYMDSLSLNGNYKSCFVPPSTRGTKMSFSGPETAIARFVKSGVKTEDVCASVFENISRAIFKTLSRCIEKHKIYNVLFVGGVSSSSYIRRRILEQFGSSIHFYFCDPKYSTDNAVGIASMCYKWFSSSING